MNPISYSIRGENPRPAVFLDRDGTVIEDRGDLTDPGEVVFFRDTVTALCRLAEHFVLFIVTNQSGVAKGTISIEHVQRVNDYVKESLATHGVPINAIYVCLTNAPPAAVASNRTPTSWKRRNGILP